MNMLITVLLILIGLLMLAVPAHAQWTEPVRISDIGLLVPRAVAVGETLHVVASTGIRTYYLMSPDNGYSWTDAVAPADTFYGCSEMPDIAYSDGLLHITYVGEVEDSYRQQIFVLSSSDGGRSWWRRRRVFNNVSYGLKGPTIAANGDTLFLSCQANHYIWAFRSLDNGGSWTDSILVESGSLNIIQRQRIEFSQGVVHLIMPFGIPGDSTGYEVYYRRSTDYGLTWSERIPLSTVERTPNVEHSQEPSAAVDDEGDIIVVWFDYKYGSECGFSGDILGRVSTDNGVTWLPETRLTYTQTGSGSSCVVLNGVLHVVWMDELEDGCGYPKISYSESSDWGQFWPGPSVISGQTVRPEMSPILLSTACIGDTVLHCFFRVSTDEGYWIYYTKQRILTEAIEPNRNAMPIRPFQISAYPNPFNSTLSISIQSTNPGQLFIYDLLGRVIRRFEYDPGNGRIYWDATDEAGREVSAGVYFARTSGANYHGTIKLIYLR